MKPHHRPLARHKVVSSISFALLLGAFFLLLLVTVSLPIIKPIYILSLKSTTTGQPPTSIATELRFGVWGVCAYDTFDEPNVTRSKGVCFGPKLGYQVPPYVPSSAGISPSLVKVVEQGLFVILVLHPIAAAFSFIAFAFSLFLGPHNIAIICLILAILTAIVSSVVFGIDLALVIIAKANLARLSQFHFEVQWGSAVWMVLVSVIMAWLAVIFLSARACYCCGVRRYSGQATSK